MAENEYKNKKQFFRYVSDPIITQLKEGIESMSIRLVGPILSSIVPRGPTLEDNEILYYDPVKDPLNFLRKPLGTSLREEMRYHLTGIVAHMAVLALLREKYPWLLSDEDYKFLDEVSYRIDSIHVRAKSER